MRGKKIGRPSKVPVEGLFGLSGAELYYGKPCPLGHTIKYFQTRNCVECQKARDKKRTARATRASKRRKWIYETIKRQEAF